MVEDEHEVKNLDMRLKSLPPTRNAAELQTRHRRYHSHDDGRHQAKAVMMLAKQIRPEVLTVMGGHHATFMPEFYDEPYVDIAVRGEGEITLKN